MLTNKNIIVDLECDRVFQMRADSQNNFGLRISDCGFDMDGQRRVAAGASQHYLAATHHTHDGVIDVTNDWTIVNEKEIGDSTQALQRFAFIDANRLVTLSFRL